MVLLTPWAEVLPAALVWPVAALTLAAIVGEARPLDLRRQDEVAETVSVSLPFVLALVAIGGAGLAVVAQALASLADDVIHRRPLLKSLFNTAQYALSVVAGGATYTLLTGQQVLGAREPVEVAHLLPLAAAGIVMIVVNRTLVACVVSMVTQVPLRALFTEAPWANIGVQAVLLSIGGIAALVAGDGAWPLLLLLAPAAATYITAAAGIRLALQAERDALTDLGNRHRLLRVLGSACTFDTTPGGGPGLVLLDLDHFKDVNDTLGHPVGDEVLRLVGARLAGAVEDPRTVHRLGGDEFAVLVEGDLVQAQRTAEALVAALATPLDIDDLKILVRASAGVASAPDHGRDPDTLLKHADIALYRAKLERDRIAIYEEHLDVSSVERLRLLADLGTAIESHALTVEYQPQVDLVTRRTVAVEALVRWQHPTRGRVGPDEFIPLAEHSGLISHLTAYVLDAALATLARWREAGYDLRMSVNLATRHLSDLALPRQVDEALARHRVPADRLVLEVTERGILSDPARVDVVIAALRVLGVGIAVDDYGTGNTSLGYLRRLAVDELKVDRSFVADMLTDRHDHVIVRSTVGLARDLGLRVVAEGVEDEETTALLQDMGCAVAQGYHLGRPAPESVLTERLATEAQTILPTQR